MQFQIVAAFLIALTGCATSPTPHRMCSRRRRLSTRRSHGPATNRAARWSCAEIKAFMGLPAD
jgi:hypothetical protein